MEFNRRDFVRNAIGAGIGLAATPSVLSLSQAHSALPVPSVPVPAPAPDPYAKVDPELLPALKQFPFPTVSFSAELLPAVRSQPSWPSLPAPAPQPFERHIPGPAGAPEVRVVIVDPSPAGADRGSKGRPAFLHIHGGGFVAGHAGQDPAFLQTVAMTCNCLVVSVDYRLAPETRFPGALEDNYAALVGCTPTPTH